MTALCLDDIKKINKWQMAVITAKFGEMGGIIGDLLLRNARLEGQVVELTKRSAVAASDGLASGRMIESKQSYSDMLKSSSGRTGKGRVTPVTNVTVRPGPVHAKTATASRASAAGAQNHGVKILSSKALAGVGLVASLPDLRDPEVLLRGVSVDTSEKDITEAIYSQNSDLFKGFFRAEFELQIKLLYRAGPKRNELVNWVAQRFILSCTRECPKKGTSGWAGGAAWPTR